MNKRPDFASQPPVDTDLADDDVSVSDELQDQSEDADEAAEESAQEAGDEVAAEEAGAAEEGAELVITIGDEQPEQDQEEHRAPAWVRELRKANREKDRRIRDLEAKLSAPVVQPAAVTDPGPRPKLEDHDFDAELYDKALDAWLAKQDAFKRAQEEKAAAERAQREAWQSTLDGYQKAKGALKVPDFDDAEDTARDILSVTQQGVILAAAEDAAKVVYALGKNPTAARRLAAVSDPVKFAAAIGRLETQLKVTTRSKTPPAPERVVRSAAAGASASDNTLERLREEAAKTGDLSKVMAYKRQLRAKQAA